MKYIPLIVLPAPIVLCAVLLRYQVDWFESLVLSAAGYGIAVLLMDIRGRTVETARILNDHIESQHELEQARLRRADVEARSAEVAVEFELFSTLGIAPTDEWRLRAAKVLKVSTPEELDQERNDYLQRGIDEPDEDWQMRAALLPHYKHGTESITTRQDLIDYLQALRERATEVRARLSSRELFAQGTDIREVARELAQVAATAQPLTEAQIQRFSTAVTRAAEACTYCNDVAYGFELWTNNEIKKLENGPAGA